MPFDSFNKWSQIKYFLNENTSLDNLWKFMSHKDFFLFFAQFNAIINHKFPNVKNCLNFAQKEFRSGENRFLSIYFARNVEWKTPILSAYRFFPFIILLTSFYRIPFADWTQHADINLWDINQLTINASVNANRDGIINCPNHFAYDSYDSS